MASSIVLLYVDIYTEKKTIAASFSKKGFLITIKNRPGFYVAKPFIDFEIAFHKNVYFSDRNRI